MRLRNSISIAFVLVALNLVTSAHAGGETKAWTKAKTVLPGGLQLVGGSNFASLRSSQLFQQLFPMALAQAGTATQLEQFKSACKLDAIGLVDSVVVGLDAGQTGLIVVAFKGTTRKDLEACAQKLTAVDAKTPGMTIGKDGAFAVYTLADKKGYADWLAADVVAFTTAPDDKDLLKKMTAGGILKSPAMKPLASINTSAGLWALLIKSQTIPELDLTTSGAYGALDIASRNVVANVHMMLESDVAATKAVAFANSKFDDLKKGSIPPPLADVAKSVSFKAAGSELVVTASVPEKSVAGLLGMFVGGAKP